jgi:hypothetical protein
MWKDGLDGSKLTFRAYLHLREWEWIGLNLDGQERMTLHDEQIFACQGNCACDTGISTHTGEVD